MYVKKFALKIICSELNIEKEENFYDKEAMRRSFEWWSKSFQNMKVKKYSLTEKLIRDF